VIPGALEVDRAAACTSPTPAKPPHHAFQSSFRKLGRRLLDLFRIPISMLPTVRSSSEVYGEVSSGTSSMESPSAGIAGDQQSALFGQKCTTPAARKIPTAQAALCSEHGNARPSHRPIVCSPPSPGNRQHHELRARRRRVHRRGCRPVAPRWPAHHSRIFGSGALANPVPDNGGFISSPAFVGLGAPHWDSGRSRLNFRPHSGQHRRSHCARCSGKALRIRSPISMDAVQTDTSTPLAELRVDGGASANDALHAIPGGHSRRAVVRPSITETTLWCRVSGWSGRGLLERTEDNFCFAAGRAPIPTTHAASQVDQSASTLE